MKADRWILMSCAALALAVAGCKSTEVVMVNDLGEDAVVTLQGPGQIKPSPPSLAVTNTEKAVFKVQTPLGKLPADYEWQAGGRAGTIVVSENSPDRQMVNLSTGKHAPEVSVKVKP